MQKRLEKAANKSRVITRLAQADRQARVLARTGHRPVIWGLEGQGLAPPTLRKLRAQVAGMSTCRQAGGCATTAIMLGFTEHSGPFVGARKKLLKEWVGLWDSLQPQHKAVERAWGKLHATLRAAKSPWGRTEGPISAVICTLMDFKWTPEWLHTACRTLMTSSSTSSTATSTSCWTMNSKGSWTK